ncbi:hypothetical protein U9M48_043110 [Paspalum notatum var. saurae]|uniref:BED-type domain-containing protein n=1 Tax=Paspalum notatum var. saurae TaxID=547442 RepID=A0AAQ3XGS7_PASNO
MEAAENNPDDRPLWNHVNILEILLRRTARVSCKYCGGSYPRVKAHLLLIHNAGTNVCPNVTEAILQQLQNEIAQAEGQN